MKKSDAYPNKWLRAPDMIAAGQTNGLDLTITGVSSTKFEDGQEMRVLSFAEGVAQLGLNRLNWEQIAEISGLDDDDLWKNIRINVYPQKLDRPFNGHTHGLRVRPARGAGKPSAAQIDEVRKAAFAVLKLQADPTATTEELKALWLAAINKKFPGKRQIELSLADWEALKRDLEGYAGEPGEPGETEVADPVADNDIPF